MLENFYTKFKLISFVLTVSSFFLQTAGSFQGHLLTSVNDRKHAPTLYKPAAVHSGRTLVNKRNEKNCVYIVYPSCQKHNNCINGNVNFAANFHTLRLVTPYKASSLDLLILVWWVPSFFFYNNKRLVKCVYTSIFQLFALPF